MCKLFSHPGRALLGGLAGLLLLGGLVAGCVTQDNSAEESTAPGTGYNVTPRQIPLIPAGTTIGTGPPKSWSHLIIKSCPRAGAGDVDKLSAQVKSLSGMFFTSIVADVKAGENGGPHRLDKVAMGLGTRVGEEDVIITSETQKRLGANLGLLARAALDKAYGRLKLDEVVVRSNTMAVIDVPILLLLGGKHRPAILRYALLVDPPSGRLEVLLWGVERDDEGKNLELVGPVEWLPPSKIQDCVFHVDGSEVGRLGVPADSAFAISRVHQGKKQLEPPDELKKLAARSRLTEEEAGDLDRKLRALLERAASR